MRRASLKNVTIIELMVAINRRYSEIPALQIKRGTAMASLSYIELGRRTSDTAYNLKLLGVEKQDRVAILSESKPEWAIAFFGIVSCGGITVPMDVKLSDTEIEFILNDSGAKCLFVSEKFIERILALWPKLKSLTHIICLDEVAQEGILLLKDFKVPPEEIAHREIQPDDVALIVYTSGTTGTAKGVELTYKNLLFEVMSLHELITFSPKDEFLSILPLNHMLEITGGFLGPLYAGATVTYCESLKPTTMLSLMHETKTTVMICVPLVLKMFHNSIIKKMEELPGFKRSIVFALLHLSRYLLKFHIRIGKVLFSSVHKQFGGHLRCFVSGGAPLDPVVELDFNAMGFRILQGYGLTETSPVITVNNFEECKYGSVGKPLEGAEVNIICNNESLKQEGEIITRGPHVMRGYYKNTEKTNEVLRDGWFYTGDIGFLDRDGFLFISGRIKNLIVLGAGKKVFPEEIEEVMSASHFIKEICVLGRVAQKGIRKGCEEVYAVIVPNLDSFAKEERHDKTVVKKKIMLELMRLGEHLAEYKRIMDFELWDDELPKTSTRKIKRKVLLEMISRKEAESGVKEKKEFVEAEQALDDATSLAVKQVLQNLLKNPGVCVNGSTNLYNELGIDSLMKVELLAAIHKQIGVEISDRLAYEINTFGDLLRFIKEYQAGRSGDEIGLRREINDFIRANIRYKAVHNLSYFMLKGLFGIYFKQEVFGLERVPTSGSFIIAANHTSLLDFPLVITSLPYRTMKNVFAPAAADYFYAKRYRKAMVELLFNTFPFERMGDFMKGIKVCEELIKSNHSIILFPEGTRTQDGSMKTFKPGLGSLAMNLRVPILPVYIHGAFDALPKGKRIPYPKKIEVHFGEAIMPDAITGSGLESNYDKYALLSQRAFEAIVELKNRR
ncbi:MAG: AMP-binding protein [Candidatus Omnitrophica bacterium]|nr:AMP-binding protein [Candidatus Omnitrophota bacterium]